jgi:uncharacterized protein (TIGR00375 family)
MRYIADLHIHSKYSRACSKDLDLEGNTRWARIKGIDIVGTGDFTHPIWLKELKDKLEEKVPGLYCLKKQYQVSKTKASDKDVFFMLTTELSCIYSQGGKTRRIHLCVWVPDFKTVDAIVTELENRKVNLRSDGRPIMGLSAIELTKIVMQANSQSIVVPAHMWTPWFSVFGSKSGFDSLEECFGETTKYIFAGETGLSSDPAMNYKISALDDLVLVSNSDAHSPANLGREANVFEINEKDLSFFEIRKILQQKDSKRFLYTIEFFPEEGKYHADGHEICGVRLEPNETKKLKGICPKCKKPLTIGVLSRVEELADRKIAKNPHGINSKYIIPLPEVIAEAYGIGKNSKKVQSFYFDMINKLGSEFDILLDVPIEKISQLIGPEIAKGISLMRDQKVSVTPGYDGVYGVIKVFGDSPPFKKQKSLF